MTLRSEDCKPGTLVECISQSPRIGRWLTVGAIYTVEHLISAADYGYWKIPSTHIALKLQEVDDCAFGLIHFRLLPDERLEVFRAMLQPIKRLEPTP